MMSRQPEYKKVIYKYPVPSSTSFCFTGDAWLLKVGEQRGDLQAWVQVDEHRHGTTMIELFVVPTGSEFELPPGFRYFDTAIMQGGDLVLHVYFRRERK